MEKLPTDPYYYAFDLDGTLANCIEGQHYAADQIGPPIPAMIDLVKKYLARGLTVKIFTARYWRRHTNPEVIPAIEKWCEEHLGQKLEITNEKTPGLRILFDDRAVSVKRNEAICLDANGKML